MTSSAFALAGKRALIVGATGGIGEAITVAFAASGATLALAARSQARLGEVAAKIRAGGGAAESLELDLRHPDSIAAAVRGAIGAMGGLDVAVVASGISPIFRAAEDISIDDWDQIIGTNLRGPFLLAQAAGRHMLGAAHGSIVFVTSVHQERGTERLAAYAASKAAVAQLARCLAIEWAPRGVRVNCLAPGYVTTDMTAGLRASPQHLDRLQKATPMGRLAEPDEIAGAAVFLASDAARYVTGTTVFVDGGWSAR